MQSQRFHWVTRPVEVSSKRSISSGSTCWTRARSSSCAARAAHRELASGRVPRLDRLPDVGDQDGVQRPVEDGRRERRHARRLDLGVEALVVARGTSRNGSGHAASRRRRSWRPDRAAPPVAADAAGCLDVLGGRLRLADHGHEREPVDVNADLDDVRGQADVDGVRALGRTLHLQLLDRLRHLVVAQAAGQFETFQMRRTSFGFRAQRVPQDAR